MRFTERAPDEHRRVVQRRTCAVPTTLVAMRGLNWWLPLSPKLIQRCHPDDLNNLHCLFWRFGQIFPSMVQTHATRFTLSKMRTLIFITFGVAAVIGVGPVLAADRDVISIAQLEGVTEPNCATRLKGFIIDIDDLLAQSP